jgi:hypothetical protein
MQEKLLKNREEIFLRNLREIYHLHWNALLLAGGDCTCVQKTQIKYILRYTEKNHDS